MIYMNTAKFKPFMLSQFHENEEQGQGIGTT